MSSLVSDFIINPVLRQARRFSRSSSALSHANSSTGQDSHDSPSYSGSDLTAIMSEGANNRRDESALEEGPDSVHGILGGNVVASPMEQDTQLGSSAPIQRDRAISAPTPAQPPTAVPLRLSSYRSDNSVTNDDVSNNPTFGIPERFQNGSPMTVSLDSLTQPITRMNSGTGSSQRSRQDSASGGNRHRNGSLPEDDGMNALRRKIISIQGMELSPEEKAQMMHQLMTEGYSNSQINLHGRTALRTQSPAAKTTQEQPTIPSSLRSFSFWQSNDHVPEKSAKSAEDEFQLQADDLVPTWTPLKPVDVSADSSDTVEIEETVRSLGCVHYKRNVKLQCSTCSRWYTCRLCHDEVEDHVLIRRDTRNMLCMLCGRAQRAGEICAGCGARAAWYYCGVCKLWDDDTTKSIYHCHDCGICRIGRGLGKDFFHCKTCGLCMSISMEQGHKCIERSTDCDCPICGEYMFTSPQTVVFMRCGHTIHRSCYYAHMKSSYKCPICSQTVINMETQFRNLDRATEAQPMPPQFNDTKAMVSCNDCRAKSAVKYHWLGLKCAVCDSYNTAQLQIITDPAEQVIDHSGILASTEVGIETEIAADTDHLQIPHVTGPTRTRRHSSHHRAEPSSSDGLSRFSPYPMPQRIGRSESPLGGGGTWEDTMAIDDLADETVGSDDDNYLDFWGRDLVPARTSMIVSEDMTEESDMDLWGRSLSADIIDQEKPKDENSIEDEEEDDSDESMGEADDGGDEEEIDAIQLFGHR